MKTDRIVVITGAVDSGKHMLRCPRGGPSLASCSSDTAIGEERSRRRMERAGVWLTSTNTMVAELVQDWSTPQGRQLVMAMNAIAPMLPVTWAKP